ncbi:cysteine-rich receptor-like protein kinase 10 [Aristolochia californica]|uniref:cysteine-rich receptor-like protein kinase 10 n=1 Tax=Aristolochia californica TaxID=171875 RepID=UPI0035DEC6A2
MGLADRLCCCLEKKGSKWRRKGAGDDEEEKDQGDSWDLIFELETLEIATDNFSEENLLGHGGFGPVYKGRLANGQEIAVKKLSVDSRQGHEEFMNEVKFLVRVQHRNLVTLLGCCAHGREKALIYDYLPNKSLDKFLFDKMKSGSLDWSKRFEIIFGVARGLLYLHEESPLRIIHRDIKASNILLDNQLNPKISDFGMARLFAADDTHVNTFKIAGTHGYMAPEYALHGYLSVKSDVFSYGVLVLEIVSGWKNYDRRLPDESGDLLSYAWKLFEGGKALELVDNSLDTYDESQAAFCVQLGLLCCQANIADRPDMNAVNLMLSSDSFILPKPGKPGLQGRRGYWSVTRSTLGSGTNASSSVNPFSTTTGASKISNMSTYMEDESRNSISVSFTEDGR